MNKRILITCLLTIIPSITFSGSHPVYYCGIISAHDRVSSSGTQLTSVLAILAQDRANYHKFNKADDYDGSDDVFMDAGLRAQIPSARTEKAAYSRRDEWQMVNSERPTRFCVRFELEGGIYLESLDTYNPEFNNIETFGSKATYQ